MTVKEYVNQSIVSLNDVELAEVAEYLAFLKFRARSHVAPPFDPIQAARLYAEFASEDHQLAEEGMTDYAEGLAAEDLK